MLYSRCDCEVPDLERDRLLSGGDMTFCMVELRCRAVTKSQSLLGKTSRKGKISTNQN